MRRPAASLTAALLLLTLAGCTGPLGGSDGSGADDGLRADLKALDYGPLIVRPTPAEAFEKPGDSVLEWDGEWFGILSQDPASGLRYKNLVRGDTLYSSNQEIGWYIDPYPGDLSKVPRTARLPLWNLPALVQHPDLDITVRHRDGETNYTLTGTPEIGGGKITLSLQLAARDGKVTWARLTAPQILESPFMFHAGGELPFPMRTPENVLDTGTAIGKERTSVRQHSFLVQLIHNYTRNHAGMVPPTVDEETLALELLTTGKEWPVNPFDGEKLRHDRKSGHFNWCTKGSNVGAYTSYGFDNVLGHRPFGAQCP